MPVFYVDASALIKRYRSERGSDVVNAIFADKGQDDAIVASQIVTVEVESAAGRALKSGALKQSGYGIMLESFSEDLETLIVIPVSPALIAEAAQVARQYHLRSLDAVHFATALRIRRTSPSPNVPCGKRP